MKVKYLDLRKLDEKTILKVKEDSFFVLEPVKNSLEREIRLEISKQKTKAKLIFAAVVKNSALDLEIEIVHKSSKTTSNVQIRTVLEEAANFNFRGNIKVEKNSAGASGVLDVKGLSLGENISWNIQPNLEIENQDVEVNHKASLVSFSRKQITYLRSRGLSPEEATSSLKKGFLLDVLTELPEDKSKNKIIKKLKL